MWFTINGTSAGPRTTRWDLVNVDSVLDVGIGRSSELIKSGEHGDCGEGFPNPAQ